MSSRIPELLAPAGSWEALQAAANNGADAIYVGAGAYNARVFAENPSPDDLDKWVLYAHLRSCRVYITLNTILFDHELPTALDIAKKAWAAGADGIIVQDWGLMSLLSDAFPDLPLHASTQMNFFHVDSLDWARENGLRRVVLPRELSLREISTRAKNAAKLGLETEVFIHGAQCMCYSGICYFSALHKRAGRSGNRGTCSQPCRMSYRLLSPGGKPAEERYLSPRDRWSIPLLAHLSEAGVTSLKIEGRMKNDAYVGVVVRTYRDCLDELKRTGKAPDDYTLGKIEERLAFAFNRGGTFSEHYMRGNVESQSGQRTSDDTYDFFSGRYPGKYGVLVGPLRSADKRNGNLAIAAERETELVRGDVLSLRQGNRELFSFPVGKLESSISPSGNAILLVKGLNPVNFDSLPSDVHVYQMTNLSDSRAVLSSKSAFRTPVTIELKRRTSCDSLSDTYVLRAEISAGIYEGLAVSLSENISKGDAGREPLSEERIQTQLQKTGDTPFTVSAVLLDSVEMPVSVALLNTLRRSLLANLEGEVAARTIREFSGMISDCSSGISTIPDSMSNSEATQDTSSFVQETHIHYSALARISGSLNEGADSYSFSIEDVLTAREFSRIEDLAADEPSAKFWLWLPGAFPDTGATRVHEARERMRIQFKDNYGGIFSSIPQSKSIPAAENFVFLPESNLANRFAVDAAIANGASGFCPSNELTGENLRRWLRNLSANARSRMLYLHVYGRIPWMQMRMSPLPPGASADSALLSVEDIPDTDKRLPILELPAMGITQILGSLEAPVSDGEELAICHEMGQRVCSVLHFLDETPEVRKNLIAQYNKTRRYV